MNVIYICPVSPEGSCTWEGPAGEVLPHFERTHRTDLINSNIVTINLQDDLQQQHKLMLNYNDVYLIQIKYELEQNKVRLFLRYLGSRYAAKKVKYYLEVTVNNYAFTSKDTFDGYTPVRVENEGIVIDIDTLKTTCGRFQAIACQFCFENVNKMQQNTRKLSRVNSFNFTDVPIVRSLSRATSFQKVFDQICPEEDFFNEIEVLDEPDSSECDSWTQISDLDISYRDTFDDRLEPITEEILEETSKRRSDRISVESITSFFRNAAEKRQINKSDNQMVVISCTNCFMYMTTPIYVCESGHSICFICHNDTCKICNKMITDVRNTDIEELSKETMRPCRFAKVGCNQSHIGRRIREHELKCDFSSYICPLCKTKLKYADIELHWKILHYSVKIIETLTNPFPINTHNLIVNKYGIFFIKSILVSDNTIEWYVVFCGLRDNLSYVKCDVIVKGKKTYTNSYSLERNGSGNEFRRCISLKQLKTLGVKDKKTVLSISCIP